MEHMASVGLTVVEGVTPRSIEKLESGKLRVTYEGRHDHTEDFDTVLAAVGMIL